MSLTWEELEADTGLRNVAIQEVEVQLMVLESMQKRDISVTCYQHTYETIAGFMLEIKQLQSNFRRKAFENELSQNKDFKEDAKALVEWKMKQWNRLDKLKPSKMPILSPIIPDQSQGLSVGDQGNIMHDALHNLNVTLERSNEECDTNTNITRPYFKGGKDSCLSFESYAKNF